MKLAYLNAHCISMFCIYSEKNSVTLRPYTNTTITYTCDNGRYPSLFVSLLEGFVDFLGVRGVNVSEKSLEKLE